MGDDVRKEDTGLLVHLRWRKGAGLRACMAQDSLAEAMLRPASWSGGVCVGRLARCTPNPFLLLSSFQPHFPAFLQLDGGHVKLCQKNASGSWCGPLSAMAYWMPPCKILQAPFPFPTGGVLRMAASQRGQVWVPKRLCGVENHSITTFFISWHHIFEETRIVVQCLHVQDRSQCFFLLLFNFFLCSLYFLPTQSAL